MAIVQAVDRADVDACRELFEEYQRALGVSLCFQGFDRELAALPGDYAPPAGRLLLARDGGQALGCVALRPLGPGECEMKRLYVRPAHRGSGVGRRLAERIVEEARAIGYRRMRLDTLPFLDAAIALYRSLGFVESNRYNDNPLEGVRFMALELASAERIAPATSSGS